MNTKNRLSGQVLRIAALAVAISLIFGSMAIFYAESDPVEHDTPQAHEICDECQKCKVDNCNYAQGVCTCEETDPTASDPSSNDPSSSDPSSSDPSSSDPSSSDPSSSDPSSSDPSSSDPSSSDPSSSDPSSSDPSSSDPSSSDPSSSETQPSDAEVKVEVFVKNSGSMRESMTTAQINQLKANEAQKIVKTVNFGDKIYVRCPDGVERTLKDAYAYGARYEITGNPMSQCASNKVTSYPVTFIAGEYVFYVFHAQLLGTKEGDVVEFPVPIKVTFNGSGESAEAELKYQITNVSSGSESSDPEETTTTSSKKEDAGTTTTKKGSTTTTKKSSSNSNTGGSPDTGDVTIDQHPERNIAAIGMLTVGLIIIGAIVAERIYRANQDKKRRANAIRR